LTARLEGKGTERKRSWGGVKFLNLSQRGRVAQIGFGEQKIKRGKWGSKGV